MNKLFKQILRLSITLTTANLLMSCSVILNSIKESKQPEAKKVATAPPIVSPALKDAIHDLQDLKIKSEGEYGIKLREYEDKLKEILPVAKVAQGDEEALAAMKSAVEGHRLALEFWQCDHLTGYDNLHQCRDKALQGIFNKYPEIKEQALAIAQAESSSFISAGLDQQSLLEAIWSQANGDTAIAHQIIYPPLDVINTATEEK
ncbi:MAG: hypothetical protein F6K41_02155 [Symploca sp. SIO3E6]|nr:hypothetical protein [Caldora sp. SIO3E6]